MQTSQQETEKSKVEDAARQGREHCCPELPEFRRLQYFYGQLLSSQDFQDEQSYFREKLRLLARCFHGYGVVCGLNVTAKRRETPCEPEVDRKRQEIERQLAEQEEKCKGIQGKLQAATREERPALEEALKKCEAEAEKLKRGLEELCPPSGKTRPPDPQVVVDCGVALDCRGNLIVLRKPHPVELLGSLSEPDRQHVQQGRGLSIYLSICYCELPVEPVRPVHADSCTPPSGCRHAKIQDSYRILVTLEPPKPDMRCEPCCCSCKDACLLVARIDNFHPKLPVRPQDIHNEARRNLSFYQWTTITGINWVHGGHYTDEHAGRILGRGGSGSGLEFHFSRPVLTDTLKDGIVDVWVIEGGKGRSGGIYNVAGRIVGLPTERVTNRLQFQQKSDDKFHEGDRILIRLRADFILDECCRPLDGNHVGGRVPLVPGCGEHPGSDTTTCRQPPGLDGPWTSGNGQGGGVFESWVFVSERGPQPKGGTR